MIIFYIKQFDLLKNKIKDIIYAIKNLKFFEKDKGKNKKENNSENIIQLNDENKINKINNNINKINIDINKKKTKKVNNKKKWNKSFIKKSKHIKINEDNNKNKNKKVSQNKKNNKGNNNKKGNNKSLKKKPKHIEINNGDNDIINNNNLNNNNILNINKKKKRNNILTQGNSKSKDKSKEERVKTTMEYNDDEINELDYNLALQYDKRTFCQYYISLLKTKHDIIFSFFYNKDYNSKIIKIDLFFIGFTIYYTVNALFYTDDTMHNIHIKNGSFDIEYQLPKIVISSLISMALNTLLKILALSNSGILKLKQDKKSLDIKERGDNLNNNLNIKFVLYFIISFIFLLFFWYYLSMFGAIYKNTQYYLLKDTLISFALSQVYPFGINLIPGIFRLPSLSDSKNKRECLYKFSKILQIF